MAKSDAATESAAQDLKKFGYLRGSKYSDAELTRGVTRFQRHAARPYRLPQDTPDVFRGGITGVLDDATLLEIAKWKERGWTLPLGRFPLVNLAQGGKARSDAAAAWETIVSRVTSAGGTLEGPYGDTLRTFDFKGGPGSSRHSFHFAGRAIDISQPLGGGGRKQRYYIEKEPDGGTMYWRIWCKTSEGRGTVIKAKEKIHYDLFTRTATAMPAGNYIDMTALIEQEGLFERIAAQSGWESSPKKLEWWHFQYTVDKQPTILDELELIGISEARLISANWAIKDLDHAPG